MDTLNYDCLKMLAHPRKGVGISIYMPFNDGAMGDLKNPATLKEILSLAKTKLLESGTKPKVVEKLLKPAYEIVENETYWRDKFETLAIFIFPDEIFYFKFPFTREKTLVISRYPFLEPMLHDYSVNKRIYVLVLEAGGSRLFKYSKYRHIDMTPKALMKSSKNHANYFQIERMVNFHIKRAGGEKTMQGLISHGRDNTAQLNKMRATEYARLVAKEAWKVTKKEDLPLVLAGIKSAYLVPTFRSAYKGVNLVDDYIQVETAPLDMERLRAGVLKVINDLDKVTLARNIEAATNLLGTGLEEDNPEKILQAAFDGRVETLFVNQEKTVWGKITDFNDSYKIQETENPDDESLTNIALINVWSKGGKVFFVTSETIGDRPMMATLRG